MSKFTARMYNFLNKYFAKIKLIFASLLLVLFVLFTFAAHLFFNTTTSFFVQFALATLALLFFGKPYFTGFYREIIKRHKMGMNTLICLSVITSYLTSIVIFILSLTLTNFFLHTNFFAATGIILTILYLGNFWSKALRSRLNNDQKKLTELLPKTALLYDKAKEMTKTILVKDVRKGDLLLVPAKTQIPVDGFLVSEELVWIDESKVTGETALKKKKLHDILLSGTVNENKSFVMQCQQSFANSALTQLVMKVKSIKRSIIFRHQNWHQI